MKGECTCGMGCDNCDECNQPYCECTCYDGADDGDDEHKDW